MNQCLQGLFKCGSFLWPEKSETSADVYKFDLPPVCLDTSAAGADVVIVKNFRRICGTGSALANAPILQDKAYFEIKVQSTGVWSVGLATSKVDLNRVPAGDDAESWVLREDGSLYHGQACCATLPNVPEEGDVLGLTYDHVELKFYLNGVPIASPVTGIKGTVYPIFTVDNGAILDVQFANFYHKPPEGFSAMMIEKSLL